MKSEWDIVERVGHEMMFTAVCLAAMMAGFIVGVL